MDYKTLLNSYLNYSDNLILILSSKLHIKAVNPAALKALGWKKQEVCNKSIEHAFKKYAMKPFIESSKPVKKEKTIHYFLPNQRLKITWKIIPIYNKEKKLNLIFILGKYLNDLKSKQVEYLQLENVVRYAPGFFYWKDKNSVYLGCNEEFASLSGLKSSEEVIGKTDFDLIWKDRAQLYVDVDQEIIRTGKANLNHEEKITVSHGRTITSITNKVPLFDSQKNVMGILGITTDITEQKKIEEELSLARVAAESANVLKTNFIQNMQHDIRTPASSVWAVLNHLVENKKLPDEELLIMLRNSAQQLLSICNDVIDFDRIENGDMPILAKRFDIRQLVTNIIELNQISAFDKKLTLSYVVDDRIPQVVKGDEHRISRILINLMGNAIKFTPKGFIKLTVKLLRERKKDYIIQFKLEDSGIGISKEEQNTLYEKFNRLNPANRSVYKGSGLGLRIVKKYVKDLDGEINVQSELKKGTIFFVDIPLEKSLVEKIYDNQLISSTPIGNQITALPDKIIEASSPVHVQNNKQFSVLLIEDNNPARKIGAEILKSMHCNVTTAIDVVSALEVLEKLKFDFVVADIGLPDGTGIDIVETIKSNNKALNFRSPFFALTANADSSTKKESIKAGFLVVMEKPIRKQIIQNLIDEFVLSNDNSAAHQITEHKSALGADLPATEEELFNLNQYPLLDVANGISVVGDVTVFSELVKEMAFSITSDITGLEQAHNNQDWQRLEELAHKTKGGAAYCGVIRVRYACQYLERYRKAGYSKLLEKLYEQLLKVLEDTQVYLERWITRQI